MKNTCTFLVIAIFALLMPCAAVFAQQLRVVEGNATTTIDDPGVYRAYYGKLSGEPHVYTFRAEGDIVPVKFVILVPDIPGAKTDIVAVLVDELQPEEPFTVAD